MSSAALIEAAPTTACRPWPRHILPPEQWAALQPDDIALLALWADTAEIHALFAGPQADPLLASTAIRDGRYYALSPVFAAAAAPERMIQDLWGHAGDGAADTRPWLDHGAWPLTHPMSPRPGPAGGRQEPQFRPAIPGCTQLPIGPASGALAEPVHLRIQTDSRTIQSAEARLGYAHKGTLLLMRGKSPRAAARFAARLSADSTVADSVAFARAAEAALGTEPPPRAAALRGAMLALERIATHLDVLAEAMPRATFGLLHEAQLQMAAGVFGHRLMMDCVVPGGLASDVPDGAFTTCLSALEQALPRLAAALPAEPDPVATLLRRRLDAVSSAIPLAGAAIPPGPVGTTLPPGSGEGLGQASGPRGETWHWLRLDGGTIAAAFAADPSWLLWPQQEAALAGARLADLASIDTAFGCARSGVDL